jgi:hypothetical protein
MRERVATALESMEPTSGFEALICSYRDLDDPEE